MSRPAFTAALAHTPASGWRNRPEFFTGRAAIVAFRTHPWQVEPAHPGLSDPGL